MIRHFLITETGYLITAEGHLAQEVRRHEHAGQVGAGDRQPGADVGTDGHEDGVVVLQQRRGVLDAVVELQFDPLGDDGVNLPLHHLRRQPQVRHAHAHHAAGHRQRLEHGGGVALTHQIKPRCQPRRPRPHNRHPRFDCGLRIADCGLPLRLRHFFHMLVRPVGHKPLQGHDVDRLVHLAAAAGVLAAVVADPPADGGEGVVFQDGAVSVGVASLGDEGHVALGALVDGAGVTAGRCAQLLDGVGVGDGLGIELVDGMPFGEAAVEVVQQSDGAGGRAIAAAGALLHVHVAWMLLHGNGEVTRLAFDALHVGAGKQLDVQMPPHLHQLGRHDAHGAVVGGEGLVELGHDPADGRGLVQQVDLEAGFGQVQRGLHAADSGADDQHRAGGLFSVI